MRTVATIWCLLFFLNLQAQVELYFSHDSGYYSEEFALNIIPSIEGMEIRYKINGNNFPSESELFETEILINSDDVRPTKLSLIESADRWSAPESPGTAVCLTAQAFWNNEVVSKIYRKYYLFDERQPTTPTIFLSIDERDFFDAEEGIYIEGNDNNYFGRGADWERPVDFLWIDANGEEQFSQSLGVRIHGNGSRRCAQKSLRFYAREAYGSRQLIWPLFPQKPELVTFDRFILRTPCSDWLRTGMRDVLAHEIAKNMHLETQTSRPVQMYLNGEYWGWYNLRERADQRFLANRFGDPAEDFVILENNGKSDFQEDDSWQELMSDLTDADPKSDHFYEWVNERIDLKNFIHYYCLELFSSNIDWPFTNTKYWRNKESDSNWRWLPFDFDASFIRFQEDPFPAFLNNSETNRHPLWAKMPFQTLLENPQFQREFQQEFEQLLSSEFHPTNTIPILDSLIVLHLPLVSEQADRWNEPSDIDGWLFSLEDMRTFLLERPAYLRRYLEQHFNSVLEVRPNPSSSSFMIDSPMETSAFERIELFNLQGELLIKYENIESPFEIDVRSLQPGIYILKTLQNNTIYTKRLMIEP